MKKYLILLILSMGFISNTYANIKPKFVKGGIVFSAATSIFYLKDGDLNKIASGYFINKDIKISNDKNFLTYWAVTSVDDEGKFIKKRDSFSFTKDRKFIDEYNVPKKKDYII